MHDDACYSREQRSYRVQDNKRPFCGVVIYDTVVSINYVYKNRTYYFDTEECVKVFQNNTKKFAIKTHKNNSNTEVIIGTVAMGAMMFFMMGFWIHRSW
jgi:YHS domain-containing protein